MKDFEVSQDEDENSEGVSTKQTKRFFLSPSLVK